MNLTRKEHLRKGFVLPVHAFFLSCIVLAGLTLILWFKSMRDKRKEKIVIQKYLDRYAVAVAEFGEELEAQHTLRTAPRVYSDFTA